MESIKKNLVWHFYYDLPNSLFIEIDFEDGKLFDFGIQIWGLHKIGTMLFPQENETKTAARHIKRSGCFLSVFICSFYSADTAVVPTRFKPVASSAET